mgnify:CR=1 FL=1
MQTYFIFDGLDVKIGRGQDAIKRMNSLQCGSSKKLSLLKVLEGDLETELHRKFEDWRIRGEWFQLSQPIANFLDGLESADDLQDSTEEEILWARLAHVMVDNHMKYTDTFHTQKCQELPCSHLIPLRMTWEQIFEGITFGPGKDTDYNRKRISIILRSHGWFRLEEEWVWNWS